MSKFLVETHYTCTFKIVHELDELNEKSLSEIDNRKDGKVEIVNVTVNNRKTKRSDGKKGIKSDLDSLKISHSKENETAEKLKTELSKKNDNTNIKYQIKSNEIAFLSANTWDVSGGGNYGYNSIWVNRNNSHFDILDYQPKNEIGNLTQLLDIV